MRTFTSFCLLGASTAVLAVDTAAAQSYFQRDRYESVQERSQPEFDPQPLRVGTLLVRPAVDAELIFDDNVLAAPDSVPESAGTIPGPDSDTLVRLAPRIGVRTDWANHEIAADVDVEHLEYQDLSDESRTNVRGAVRGRLDVNRELSLRGRVFAQDLTQDRRDVTANQVLDNVEYTNVGGSAGADYEQGRIRLSGTVRTAELDYNDVRTRDDVVTVFIVDQDFRDRQETAIEGRASYALSPDIAIFGEASLSQRDYSAPGTDGRDSEGYDIGGGINFELATLIRGDVSIGYFEDEPDQGEAVSGASVNALVQWFPTRLTTVSVRAARNASDPGIIDAPNAIITTGELRVDHELRRNVVLFGEAGLTQQDFESISAADDELASFRTGATYKLNRNVHLNGFYRYFNRSSDSPVRDFDQNIIGIGLTLYP